MKNIKKIKGFSIVIENIVGSIRKGTSSDGTEWSTEMKHQYGFFEGSKGSDGDEVDVFIGPNTESNFNVFVINQVQDGTNIFDEHKVMFGFENVESATKAYYDNYEDGWKGLGNIKTYSLGNFRNWLNDGEKTIHPINKNIDMAEEARIKTIQMFGEVVEGKTLQSLKDQAGDLSSFDTLVVEIASPGGSVSEGLEIMVWLDMLSQQGKEIVTVVVANAYSIASLIMLSADMRFISKHGEVMVHNPMVPEIEYANANDLQKYVNELRSLEGMMYDLYQVFTGLDKEQIKSLMDNETYLSPDESVKNGFADTVIDIKKRSFQMAVNIKTEINMSKTFNMLNRVIAAVNKSDVVNQLYHTNDGSQIEIYQADPSTYKVGDRVNIDEGEITLSDGAKLIVKGGIIEDINRDVEVAPESEEVTETPEGETVIEPAIEEPGIVESIIEAPEKEAPMAEFNEGPAPAGEPIVAPTEEPVKAKDAMPAKVVEVAETKTTTETVAEVAPDVEPEAMSPEVEPEAIEVEDKYQALVDRMAKLEAKNVEAEARATEAEAKAKEVEAKLVNASKFEDLATQAIDGIYKNTASSFNPAAKAVAEIKESKGSLFSQMKEKAGL